MTRHHILFRAFLSVAAIVAVSVGPAAAEDLSAQQILKGLKGPTPRSLSAADPATVSADDIAFVKKMQSQGRGLSTGDREQMAAIATKRPTVNLNVNFDYKAATLSPKAEPQLKALGEALTSKDLAGSVFMLGGHTDAKGGDDYNQALSERRAETVKRYLIDKYRIPAMNLVSAGYGKKALKNPADGRAAENRRVEIVNMISNQEATKQ